MFVLSFKNKSGEMLYYNQHANEYSWYDCYALDKACKFKTREEAEAMRDKLNRISKANGWFGLYIRRNKRGGLIMKTKTVIKELTKEELSDLFCCAEEGISYVGFLYKKSDYEGTGLWNRNRHSQRNCKYIKNNLHFIWYIKNKTLTLR